MHFFFTGPLRVPGNPEWFCVDRSCRTAVRTFSDRVGSVARETLVICFVFGFSLVSGTRSAEASEGGAEDEFPIATFLKDHCYACHGTGSAEAEIDFQSIDTDGGIANEADLLEVTREVLDAALMPPDGVEAPITAEQRAQAIDWIDRALRQIELQQQDDPGAVVMPRLTASQYNHVVRDLTGLTLDVSRFFPADGGAGEGFNNVGEAQPITLSHLEKYLTAASDVSAHLRASPAGPWRWSETRLAEVPTPEERQQELFLEIRQWFWEAERRLIGGHLKTLQNQTEMTHGNYWHAAWQYRHRKSLGHPDATLEEIARRHQPPLLPASLKRWWHWLEAGGAGMSSDGSASQHGDPENAESEPGESNSGEPGMVLRELTRRWASLPSPAERTTDEAGGKPVRIASSGEALMGQLRSLDDWFSGVAEREQRMRWSPDWEVSFDWRKYRTLARKGRWPMKIKVGDRREAYLLVTPALEETEADRVLWRNGKFVGESVEDEGVDEQVTPWTPETLSMETIRGAPPEWTTTDGGNAALRVRAPSLIRVDIPSTTKFLEVEAAVDESSEAVVQVAILAKPPKDEQIKLVGGRVVLSQGESQAWKRYDKARKLAEDVRSERNEEPQRRAEVLSYLQDIRPEHLGGTWSAAHKGTAHASTDGAERRFDGRGQMPFDYSTALLRRMADGRHRVQIERLEASLRVETRPAVQELRELLKEQGIELSGDRMTRPVNLPSQAAIDRWAPETQERYHALMQTIDGVRRQWSGMAREQLRSFVSQAWRRPPTPAELDQLVEKFLAELDRGSSYDVAVKVPLRIILVSPHFLFLHQRARFAAEPYRLDNFELASRLSFALWGSIPDAELTKCAERGDLGKPEVLAEQATRMLGDPKAKALATQFAGQWFKFNGFETNATPDTEMFPEFDERLAEAMYRESLMFFDEIFRNDRSILEILQADYTFANERLADHYGIEGVRGDAFQRVVLPESRRMGVLSHGSFLISTSQPQRTSPVQRGVWVMEEILGRHIPTPPPNVPELSKEETDANGLTIPEQLALHRKNPTCASCHKQIDPLGLALEPFDPLGRYRTDRVARRAEESTSAESADDPIAGPVALRDHLLEHRDEFIDHFARKLVGYLLGRRVEVGDAGLLRRVKDELQQNDYRFGAAFLEVVRSRQFQFRRESLDVVASVDSN